MKRINHFNPNNFVGRYQEFLKFAGLKVVDPISKGECVGFNLSYYDIDSYQLSLGIPKYINNNINPLYKILETTPIQIQHKPFIFEFDSLDDQEYYEDVKLVKVDRVLHVQSLREHDSIYFKKVIVSKLDNMKFMRAISTQRWMYGDNITKGGTRG